MWINLHHSGQPNVSSMAQSGGSLRCEITAVFVGKAVKKTTTTVVHPLIGKVLQRPPEFREMERRPLPKGSE
jgi:hypothetical protein